MWKYKEIEIDVNENGLFSYCFQCKSYQEDTLEGIKKSIDNITASYYTITKQDMLSILRKLDDRQKHFIKSVFEDIDLQTSYGEFGDTPFEWNFKMEKIYEKEK